MALIDISPLVDATINVWPGDTPYSQTFNLEMSAGANLTLSEIRTSVHVGAHADAPSHYLAAGADIASRSLEYYLGRCNVFHIADSRGRRIMPSDVMQRNVTAKRVLFRTDSFPDPRRWNEDFASLSPELVEWLYARGVITVGIDTPSVDPFDSKALEAHQALARCDMANLEGLVLTDVAPDREYELIALPLRLRHADASPVRAVLRTLD
ncbi:MAG TPA: cyclase family protein [Thermoanaerobaculia bacterium]|nr:cyclase family protein [Thermoanaerobaculia bacterium]